MSLGPCSKQVMRRAHSMTKGDYDRLAVLRFRRRVGLPVSPTLEDYEAFAHAQDAIGAQLDSIMEATHHVVSQFSELIKYRTYVLGELGPFVDLLAQATGDHAIAAEYERRRAETAIGNSDA